MAPTRIYLDRDPTPEEQARLDEFVGILKGGSNDHPNDTYVLVIDPDRVIRTRLEDQEYEHETLWECLRGIFVNHTTAQEERISQLQAEHPNIDLARLRLLLTRNTQRDFNRAFIQGPLLGTQRAVGAVMEQGRLTGALWDAEQTRQHALELAGPPPVPNNSPASSLASSPVTSAASSPILGPTTPRQRPGIPRPDTPIPAPLEAPPSPIFYPTIRPGKNFIYNDDDDSEDEYEVRYYENGLLFYVQDGRPQAVDRIHTDNGEHTNSPVRELGHSSEDEDGFVHVDRPTDKTDASSFSSLSIDDLDADIDFLSLSSDANDESLQRYKESLGLGGGGRDLSNPNDPRVCIIEALTMESPGRDPVTIDLSQPGSEQTLKDKPFKIKENAKFTMAVRFRVQHEILSGLQYVQIVKRKGIRVSKDSEMLGSFAPNTDKSPVYNKRFQEEEAPSGMLARGHYNASSSFVDDDKKTHLSFEWSFDIAKDW